MAAFTNTFTSLAGTPATPIFAEVVCKGHSIESDGGSKPFVNIFHFVRATGPGTGTEAQFAAAFFGINAALGAALSVAYVPDSVDVRYMDDPLRAAVVNAWGMVPLVAADRLPNFNAAVIRKITYARGRSFRGSNHYGPIAESQTLLDNLTAGGLALWQAVGAILTAWGPSGAGLVNADGSVWYLAVFSPTLSNYTTNPIAVTGSCVQSTTTNKRLGTMKRRKDRTGPSS